MKLPRNVPECRHVREKTQDPGTASVGLSRRFGIRNDVWEILDRARSPGTMGSRTTAFPGKMVSKRISFLRSGWWEGNEDVVRSFERITPGSSRHRSLTMTWRLSAVENVFHERTRTPRADRRSRRRSSGGTCIQTCKMRIRAFRCSPIVLNVREV